MIGLQKRCQTLKKQAMAEQDLNYSSGRPVGQPAGRFLADYNATAWPQLIIWNEDQMIWDSQLGPSVATDMGSLVQVLQIREAYFGRFRSKITH